MSNFRVPVVKIREIESIPGADAIELAVVGDYRSVVKIGDFQPGDLAVYLPEAAIIPDNILDQLGLRGRLAGSNSNRVKAVKLRGCLSQGILYNQFPIDAQEGDDLQDILGIIKWEPPIPSHMAGEVANLHGKTLKYDIENFKSNPDVLTPDELVEMSEKAHGTFCAISVIHNLDHEEMFQSNGLVYSKGLGSQGLVFKDNDANNKNMYVLTARRLKLHDRIRSCFSGKTVHVLGEIYGSGVQDLTYGCKDQQFAAFDINVDGSYLDRDDFHQVADMLGISTVPVLYRGPFNREIMYDHTNGKTILGEGVHIREGIVIVPLQERRDSNIGRVILKSVSGDYLTRKVKNGETTEYS
jgi:RNA ligase (TIGR02306 family)